MNRKFLLAVAALLIAIPTAASFGEESQEQLAVLMTKKLECAQQLLQGMTLNDYDKVSKNARELIRISKAVEFRVLKTPQYELFSNQFRRSLVTMDEMAKAKNTDGIALAYVDMTMTCVRCHKHVREIRMTMR